MPRPDRVYDPMTGALDKRRSKPGSVKPVKLYDRPQPAEPLHSVLGISERSLGRADGNIEKLSIKGVRLA